MWVSDMDGPCLINEHCTTLKQRMFCNKNKCSPLCIGGYGPKSQALFDAGKCLYLKCKISLHCT